MPSITHNAAASQFESETDDGLALLRYTRTGGSMDLVHTEVPESMEGGGYGTALVTAALDYARAEGLKVIPTCPFVRRFLERHDEYADLVAAS